MFSSDFVLVGLKLSLLPYHTTVWIQITKLQYNYQINDLTESQANVHLDGGCVVGDWTNVDVIVGCEILYQMIFEDITKDTYKKQTKLIDFSIK